jgi:hypothetical protein
MGFLGRRLSARHARQRGARLARGRSGARVPKKVGDLLGVTTGDTLTFYLRLAPNGRKLGPDEKQAAEARLGVGAECLRVVDENRELIVRLAVEGKPLGTDTDLRPTIALLRAMQRSLTLALSDQANRRKMAMRTDELRARTEPIYETWRGLVGV